MLNYLKHFVLIIITKEYKEENENKKKPTKNKRKH